MVLYSSALALASFLVEIVIGEYTSGRHVSYTRPVRSCMSKSDCDVQSGESCFFLYEGCSSGQCMCEATRRKQETAKFCTSLQGRANDSCESRDSCREGMTCGVEGFCRCIRGSAPTPDGLFCLQPIHRLVGYSCQSSIHTCLQKSVYGYTANDVICTSGGQCACVPGYRLDGFTCKRRRVDESGCLKSIHCELGAICVDGRCVCPTGYLVPPGYSKCIGRDVVRSLPIGAACDEINARRYCSPYLVCHRCDPKQEYKCVRFLNSRDFSILTNPFLSSSASPSSLQLLIHWTSSSVILRHLCPPILLVVLLNFLILQFVLFFPEMFPRSELAFV